MQESSGQDRQHHTGLSMLAVKLISALMVLLMLALSFGTYVAAVNQLPDINPPFSAILLMHMIIPAGVGVAFLALLLTAMASPYLAQRWQKLPARFKLAAAFTITLGIVAMLLGYLISIDKLSGSLLLAQILSYGGVVLTWVITFIHLRQTVHQSSEIDNTPLLTANTSAANEIFEAEDSMSVFFLRAGLLMLTVLMLIATGAAVSESIDLSGNVLFTTMSRVHAIISGGISIIFLPLTLIVWRSPEKWEGLPTRFKIAAAVGISLGMVAILFGYLASIDKLAGTGSELLAMVLSYSGLALVAVVMTFHMVHMFHLRSLTYEPLGEVFSDSEDQPALSPSSSFAQGGDDYKLTQVDQNYRERAISHREGGTPSGSSPRFAYSQDSRMPINIPAPVKPAGSIAGKLAADNDRGTGTYSPNF